MGTFHMVYSAVCILFNIFHIFGLITSNFFGYVNLTNELCGINRCNFLINKIYWQQDSVDQKWVVKNQCVI